MAVIAILRPRRRASSSTPTTTTAAVFSKKTITSTRCGAGVSDHQLASDHRTDMKFKFAGDDDMDAEEKKDVKVLHPKFGA